MASRFCVFQLTFILSLILIPGIVRGQQPLTVSVFNEATTIPFTTFINSPIHPALQVGTEFEWKRTKHFRFYPVVNIGYMFHQNLFQGCYANAELGIDFKASFGLNLKSKLGLGYLRTFTTRQEYQYKNGVYRSEIDRGNSRLMPSLTLGLGYDLHRNDPSSPEVFMLYQSWLEYPYSPGFIPLMSHTSFHLGGKFYTTWKRKNQ